MVVDCRVAVFGDWLPEARSWTSALQLCCSTQLESPYAAALSCSVATPPTHTSGALVCGSVGGFTCHRCLSQHKDAEKDIRPVSTYARSHTSATFSDIMSSESHFCLRSLSRCSSLLIPALLLTQTQWLQLPLLLWQKTHRYLSGWWRNANSIQIWGHE